MRATWTDSRLDDFSEETGRRFDRLERRMDDGFRDLRSEIHGVRDEMHKDIVGVHQVISSLHRTIIVTGGGMIAALIGVLATQV